MLDPFPSENSSSITPGFRKQLYNQPHNFSLFQVMYFVVSPLIVSGWKVHKMFQQKYIYNIYISHYSMFLSRAG